MKNPKIDEEEVLMVFSFSVFFVRFFRNYGYSGINLIHTLYCKSHHIDGFCVFLHFTGFFDGFRVEGCFDGFEVLGFFVGLQVLGFFDG